MLLYFFFFFQAEDGIRDKLVTGVQTCALPISLRWIVASLGRTRRSGPGASTSDISDGRNHWLSGRMSGVPLPPYAASSLDHRSDQSVPAGGASSGSAIEVRWISAPTFTM